MKSIFQNIKSLILTFIIFSTLFVLQPTTYGASFNPKPGDYITLGHLQTPIIWQVVNVKDNVITLLAYTTIEERAFNPKQTKRAADFNNSEVKKYLNSEFYEKSFTEDEKEIILNYNPEDTDKIYLPSLCELGLNNTKYLNTLKTNGKAPKIAISYKGEAFQKSAATLFDASKGDSFHLTTRNSDENAERIIAIKKNTKGTPELSYIGGFMNASLKPVIKITNDLKTQNLIFDKQTATLNGTPITLYKVNYKIKKLYINGKLIEGNKNTPKLINGSTLVPITTIKDHFGTKLQWDIAPNTITITQNTDVVKLTLNSDEAVVNGDLKKLNVPLLKYNDQVYVPLRFIVESLGGTLTYSDNDISVRTN